VIISLVDKLLFVVLRLSQYRLGTDTPRKVSSFAVLLNHQIFCLSTLQSTRVTTNLENAGAATLDRTQSSRFQRIDI